MGDELTFLRWCYTNQSHYCEQHYGDPVCLTADMHAAYEAETGNKVPHDYRVEPRFATDVIG